MDMTTTLRLQVEEWEDTYKPIVNTLSDNPSWDSGSGGLMFETYGHELDHVRRISEENPKRVWTYIDGHDYPVIVNGYHIVNRIGYFITDVPAVDGFDYEVTIAD